MTSNTPQIPPTPSESVIQAVADAVGRDATDLTTPLYSVLDPDALDRIFRDSDRTPCSVAFQFEGCDVVVTGSGADATPSR